MAEFRVPVTLLLPRSEGLRPKTPSEQQVLEVDTHTRRLLVSDGSTDSLRVETRKN